MNKIMEKYLIHSDEKVLSEEAYDFLDAIGNCAKEMEMFNMSSSCNEKAYKANSEIGFAFAWFVHCAIESIKVQVENDIAWRQSLPEEEEQHETNHH